MKGHILKKYSATSFEDEAAISSCSTCVCRDAISDWNQSLIAGAQKTIDVPSASSDVNFHTWEQTIDAILLIKDVWPPIWRGTCFIFFCSFGEGALLWMFCLPRQVFPSVCPTQTFCRGLFALQASLVFAFQTRSTFCSSLQIHQPKKSLMIFAE